MYPIKDYKTVRRGYTFGQKTFYSNFHLGVDLIIKTGTPIYMPFDGLVSNKYGTEGGKTVYVTGRGVVMRFMHCSNYGAAGGVSEGTIIGYSGNTGSLSTAPHIHVDISKGSVQLGNTNNFINPDKYGWEGEGMTIEELRDQIGARFTAIENRLNQLELNIAKRFDVVDAKQCECNCSGTYEITKK